MPGDTFSFISPKAFRKNIVESVEFAAYLWILSQSTEPKYSDEMARTIILYNISIIEALLLYRAKKQKIEFTKTVYKEPSEIPSSFQTPGKRTVLAFRETILKSDSQIWLHDLILGQEDFLGNKLHKKIRDIQEVRNTYHLSKDRSKIYLQNAEDSFDIVLQLVNRVKLEQESN